MPDVRWFEKDLKVADLVGTREYRSPVVREVKRAGHLSGERRRGTLNVVSLGGGTRPMMLGRWQNDA